MTLFWNLRNALGLCCMLSVLPLLGLEPAAAEPIRIGVAWPFSSRDDLFRQGIELAAHELNQEGGVLGRSITLVFADDAGTVSQGKLVAQRFAEEENLNAVIGHFDSHIALAASVTYAYHQLLFISPGATHPRLTKQGFAKLFRTAPNDATAGRQLAEMAKELGYRKFVVVHEQSRHGGELANSIEFRAGELDLEVAARFTYGVNSGDFRLLLDRMSVVEFDAIFFAGEAGDAAQFIDAARNEGLTQPFLGGYGLDNPRLFGAEPSHIEGTLVLSVFHQDAPDPYVQSFNMRFAEMYQKLPDAWAAQGYDALKMLAHAVRGAQSTDSQAIAARLHAMPTWYGVTGAHVFDDQGDVVEKEMVPKIVRAGKLAYFDLKAAQR